VVIDNLEDPFIRLVEKDFMFVNPYLGKYIELVYSNLVIDCYYGILLTSSDIDYNIQSQRLLHNYMINQHNETHNKNNENIISVKVGFSDCKFIHNRIYYKLQNVLAEVGVIIKGILLLGRL